MKEIYTILQNKHITNIMHLLLLKIEVLWYLY